MRFRAVLLALLLAVNCWGYKSLSSRQTKQFVRGLPPAGARLDGDDPDSLLAPILVPRVPGSENSTRVREHLATVLEKNGWHVSYDAFTTTTPVGEVEFTNVIATLDPPGVESGDVGRLVLAAHYDSKLTPTGFIGATDSAVPCGVILYVVESVTEAVQRKWAAADTDPANRSGLQIIFFDGEEAYAEWTDEDSIYGARHLAAQMADEQYPGKPRATALETIDALVLLDLVGSPDADLFVSFFEVTDWLHVKLGRIQESLRGLGLAATSHRQFFPRPPMFEYGGLFGDDHIPFWKMGVPCLHLIPARFPAVWHTENDDYAHVDKHAVVDWAHIMAIFVAEYFELGPVICPKEKADL